MRRGCALSLLACLPVSLLAASSVAQQESFTVAGRVIDQASGRPLPRTTVSIAEVTPEEDSLPEEAGPPRRGNRPAAGEALSEVTTGSDGSFHFGALAAGRYHLSASCRGYLPASFEEHGGFFAAVIVGKTAGAGEEAPNHLRFPLLPLASIRGSILDSSGDPVQSATVQLFMQSTDGSGAVRQRGATSLRRGSSSYEFSDLSPGTYYLAVTGRPWFADSNDSEGGSANPLDVAYAPSFYENASNAAAAQPIALAAGEKVQANFSLSAVPAVHVQITANHEGGVFSLPQLSAPAFDGALPMGTGVVSSRGGRENGTTVLSMSVAPGSYLVPGAAGDNVMQIAADTMLDGSPSEAATVALTGRLAMADGSPLPGNLTFRMLPAFSPTRGGAGSYIIRNGGGGPGRPSGVRPVEMRVAADGSFATDAVTSGDYRLSVQGAEGAAVLTGAAASGGRLTEDLELHVGNDPIILAGTLALANRAVSGVVVSTSGQRASGVMVVLLPEAAAGQTQPAPALFQQQESDSDGSWTIRGVAPGKYRALAIQDGWDLAWKKAGVLDRYMAGAGPVEVSAPGTTTLAAPLVAQPR